MKVIHIRNDYIIEGDITKIVLRRKDGNDLYALVDTEDLERLKTFNYAWCAAFDKHVQDYYVHATIYKERKDKNKDSEKIALHCYIMNSNPDIGEKVDHINHNQLDNRKSNLRITINENNTKHKNGANKNNKSGYRNVCWIYNAWVVQLQIDGKNTRLGKFSDVHEAGKFAEKMRQKYFGEFAGLG